MTIGERQRAIDEMWHRSDVDRQNGMYPAKKCHATRLISHISENLFCILNDLIVIGFVAGLIASLTVPVWGLTTPSFLIVTGGLSLAVICLFILWFNQDLMRRPKKLAEALPKKTVGIKVLGAIIFLIGVAFLFFSARSVIDAVIPPMPRITIGSWLIGFLFALIGERCMAEKKMQLAIMVMATLVFWIGAVLAAFFLL